MKHIRVFQKQESLLMPSLINIIDPNHELVLLADNIDWDFFHNQFKHFFYDNPGKIQKRIRLIVGLFILKHTYNFSDEKLIKHLHENFYYRYFCGIHHFSRKPILARSLLSMWRKKLGENNIKIIFKKIVEMTEELGIKKKRHTRGNY